MGWIGRPLGPMQFPTRESFTEWLKFFSHPETWEIHVAMYGKPRVRVAVERQIPNEADL